MLLYVSVQCILYLFQRGWVLEWQMWGVAMPPSVTDHSGSRAAATRDNMTSGSFFKVTGYLNTAALGKVTLEGRGNWERGVAIYEMSAWAAKRTVKSILTWISLEEKELRLSDLTEIYRVQGFRIQVRSLHCLVSQSVWVCFNCFSQLGSKKILAPKYFLQ